MTDDQRNRLIAAAVDVRQRAYAKYSGFLVGSAVLTESGQVFTGCNVENGSYGLTICAERVAAVSAVAGGQQRFEALAVATPDGHMPCGACRQFLAEFGAELLILIVDVNRLDSVREVWLSQLLPSAFRVD